MQTQTTAKNHVEQERIDSLLQYENALRAQGHTYIVGVDEAGRGPLAGPVVTAACYIPPHVRIEGIFDSKQLPAPKRAELYQLITTHPDIIYSITLADVEEIDFYNIYQATRRSMCRAVHALSIKADYLLVDGMSLNESGVPNQGLIKGDSLSYSIGAASILAKEYRDQIMIQYHEEHPQYNFKQHKGYATPEHIQAIYEFGPISIHRKSFEPVKSLIQPSFSF